MTQSFVVVGAYGGVGAALCRRLAMRGVASAIDWLLDTEQAWVTGQLLGVDRGLSRVRSRA